jgi:NAD(P)H-hydrate epimerase
MYVLEPQSMRRIDAQTIADGVPGLTLMERAGAGATQILLEHPEWLQGTILILCGPGNNGGDGFVVARYLHVAGHAVEVLLIPGAKLDGDAKQNHDRALEAGVTILDMGSEPDRFLETRNQSSPGRLLVDALLGTGFSPPLREPLGRICAKIGELGRRVVALDGPTGLDGATGQVDPSTPFADLTIALGFVKWGLCLQPGRRHSGRLRVVDLGFDPELVDDVAQDVSAPYWVDRRRALQWHLPRPIDAHKYRAGSVLLVGASRGMSGAISLACDGAYRAGAGLVEAMVPVSQHAVIDDQCVETLVHPMPETERGGLHPRALNAILERAKKRQAVAIGPGGGDDPQSSELYLELSEQLEGPLVVDADALNAIARLGRVPRFPRNCILTPHTGELARLLGVGSPDIESDRVAHVRDLAHRWEVVVLHKGAPTLVAAFDGRLAVISTGGPGLATAGSGDVLCGAIAAQLGMGLDPFEAACLGAYLHGAAGDLGERELGVGGMMAGDLPDRLAICLRDLERERP